MTPFPGAADDAALTIEGVSHRFGAVQALRDVSFRVERGAFCALLGVNGAGKTTLFSLITRLYDSTSGRITVAGFDARRQPSAALARLGVVFQSRALDSDLTLRQNLAYHAALHGIGGRAAKARIAEVLALVGLSEKAGARAEVVALVRRLIAEEGVSTLWATHIFEEIEPGDHVVVLHRGAVLADGRAGDLAGDAPLAEAFLRLTGAGAAA